MKTIMALLLAILVMGGSSREEGPVVRSADLMILTGARWSGSLTYLDYRSNRKVTIPSTLQVGRDPKDQNSFIFDYQYPDEPQAASREVVVIGSSGGTLTGERVVARRDQAGGLVLVTEKAGMDNQRPALIRHTYQISPASFSIRKEVRYGAEEEFLQRNEYRWQR